MRTLSAGALIAALCFCLAPRLNAQPGQIYSYNINTVSGGVVPGGMATLFGSNLTSATGINLASGLPLGTEFLKVEVKFNNKTSAPIFAVDNVNGQEQINFQVPWELAGQTSALLQVVNNGAASLAVKVPVLAAEPGVIAYNSGGNTFGVVLHSNFQLADSGHPARAARQC